MKPPEIETLDPRNEAERFVANLKENEKMAFGILIMQYSNGVYVLKDSQGMPDIETFPNKCSDERFKKNIENFLSLPFEVQEIIREILLNEKNLHSKTTAKDLELAAPFAGKFGIEMLKAIKDQEN